MKPVLAQQSAGHYTLSGPLTFETVTALYEDARIELDRDRVSVDLASVTHADSAGLALLVEWATQAAKKHCILRYQGIPDQLQTLLHVSGLEQVLNCDA